MNTTKTWRLRALVVLLLVTFLTGGCLPTPLRPEESSGTTAPIEQTYDANQEQNIKELALKEQARFDTLMADLFKEQVASSQILLHFSLKNPQTYGITESNSFYDDYTLAAQLESIADVKDMFNHLNAFDSHQLTEDQKITFFVLQKYLETELLADGLELYSQPLTTTIGVQAQLPILLCEYTFDDKQDVEDYLNLLANIDEYYGQLLAFYKQKADAGLMPADRMIDHIIESCESYLLVPEDNFMVETFNTRLNMVPDVTDEEKAAFTERNSTILDTDFTSAYRNLIEGLTKLKGTGTNEKGLSHYPEGKRYYEYMVKSATGTSYESIEVLLAAMEKQLGDDLMTVAMVVKTNPDVIDQMNDYSFHLTDPTAILEDLKVQIQENFPELPACNYTVKYVPKALELTLSPAFYLTPPIDDAMNNSIYINGRTIAEGNGTSNLFTVIAHEGYPGHLYQSVYFNSTCAPEIRHLLSFNGYAEGWASYVERQSYSMDNGLDPKLAELLAANTYASLGLQAILDVYINYYGWDVEKVQDFLSDFYNNPDLEVCQSIYDAMVENPANYLSYYVGFMEMENMRQEAQKTLKDDFSLKEFHRFVLDMGPAPFSVIRTYFESWMAAQK